MARASRGSTASASPAATSARPHGATLWWGGLGCGAMVVLSPGSAVLLTTLMVPVVLIALLPEEGGAGQVAKASSLFGLAASIHPLLLFWNEGTTLSAAIMLVRQPLILATTWVAILTGWFTSEAATIVVRLFSDIAAAGERRSLSAAIVLLEEEWGPLPARPEP